MPEQTKAIGACPECGRVALLKRDGKVRVHGGGWVLNCPGSGRLPKDED